MPFPFRFVCDLLQKLHDESQSKKKQNPPTRAIVEQWFRKHRTLLDASDTDAAAILSTLLPARRTDRVYSIQVNRLESVIGRAMSLGSRRLQQLRQYTKPGLNKDLADCVEGLLTECPNAKQKEETTVEEIDESLHRIAASCRYSSLKVQSSRDESQKGDASLLARFYTCLSARDAKWFTRLVLKDFSLTELTDHVVCKAYDPMLPQALAVRDDFSAAIALLRDSDRTCKLENLIELGTKVGRQPWLKGRSIKHCTDMIGKRQISCEQKIDGEYCQIHIDLSKPSPIGIQIFSKSGKDSTKDRVRLHPAIRSSLKLGTKNCPIKKGCIIEGELVAYSDKYGKILPFHKIRKHVSRSGSFLGTGADSQPHDHEHLMIIYYDVLMIDGLSLVGLRHSERFRKLNEIITTRKGHAELVQRQVIDFRKQDGRKRLKDAFAKCIIARGEGLVLKPDDPYFDFSSRSRQYASCAIKLKKEYLKDFGEVGDFAVVGASYDAAAAKKSKVDKLRYTHFFLACLKNPREAQAQMANPKYTVTNVVTLNDTQLKYFMIYCNPPAVPPEENTYSELDFAGLGDPVRPTSVFANPPVFDVYCFAFDKPPNSRIWTMRFPQVSKIHHDRSYLDVLSSEEFHEIAQNAREAPEMEDSQEMRLWLSRIETADPKEKSVNYDSQATVSTVSTDATASATSTQSETDDGEEAHATPRAPVNNVAAVEGLRAGLVTPPRSSATNTVRADEISTARTASNTTPRNQKRVSPDTEEPSASKRLKTSSQISTVSTTKRRPLGTRDANDSQRTSRSARSMSLSADIGELGATPPVEDFSTSSVNGSFHTANEPPSSPSDRTPRKRDNNSRFQSAVTTELIPQENVTCGHNRKKTSCAFENCKVLLSPCISNYAWIQDLLRGHGILEFAVDPATWMTQVFPSSSSATSTPRSGNPASRQRSGSTRKKRPWKICLVEVRRPGPTSDFMRTIEAADLKRQNGQREWISVYDWRILEDITRIESGSLEKGPDPWRARYVGLA